MSEDGKPYNIYSLRSQLIIRIVVDKVGDPPVRYAPSFFFFFFKKKKKKKKKKTPPPPPPPPPPPICDPIGFSSGRLLPPSPR